MKKLIIFLSLIAFLIPTNSKAAVISRHYSNSYSLMVGEYVKLETSEAGSIKWASKNKKIAIVSKKGTVKALKSGVTVIIAKVNGKTIEFDISVSKGNNAYIASVSTGKGDVAVDTTKYITKDTYDTLSNGMSYDDAASTIGANGSLTSYVNNDSNNTQTEVYTWMGEDGVSNATITFVNGKITDKSETSLQ